MDHGSPRRHTGDSKSSACALSVPTLLARYAYAMLDKHDVG
jgi:hypothetical protein